MSIHVHIERLILDGLPVRGGEGTAVRAALEAELARLLGEGGLADQSAGAVPFLPAGAIELTGEAGPSHLGRQIAGAIHAGFGCAPAAPHPLSPATGPQT